MVPWLGFSPEGAMADTDSKIYAQDPDDPKSGKNFPQKPSTMDYVKEAFLPSMQRAQLEALRKAKAKSGV